MRSAVRVICDLPWGGWLVIRGAGGCTLTVVPQITPARVGGARVRVCLQSLDVTTQYRGERSDNMPCHFEYLASHTLPHTGVDETECVCCGL